jgi:hypothetical protein
VAANKCNIPSLALKTLYKLYYGEICVNSSYSILENYIEYLNCPTVKVVPCYPYTICNAVKNLQVSGVNYVCETNLNLEIHTKVVTCPRNISLQVINKTNYCTSTTNLVVINK